jgi:tRNA pseudouridine55 synthase
MLNIYKPIGLTPLQLINKLINKNSEYKSLKIGFAGRLDPLAHGVMLLMIGDETKNRDKYLNLDKEYEFEVLFGVSTDTYDVMGLLQNENSKLVPVDLEKQIKKFIKSKLGKQIQIYPPYSSKEVKGKPLYQWALENKLDQIVIPTKEINIYKFKLLNTYQITPNEFKTRINENISTVKGNFRQYKILKKWNAFFKKNKYKTFDIAKFKIKCSSGTYVRSLANEMGEKFGCKALAFSILRTKVGAFKLSASYRL